ncbi:MAG: hypothetical protein IJI49_04365 [Bacilli bacterium]|nr:hypothetical protein [Bacilli bacterium]
MEEKALKVLQILEENGYEAYIVGGYVRNKLLGLKSNDIDICTSATPKEVKEIFKSSSSDNYGSVTINYKNISFDITTFRRDIKYVNNRIPIQLKYIKDIKKDLLRRDFTINTICMNSKGEIIDKLEIMNDLDNKIIRTVGNPKYRLKEDSLRILRAVRFSSILDFSIEEQTKSYMKKYGNLLKNLSFTRKKQELDKIFSSVNNKKGIDLLLELELDKPLQLNNLKNINPCHNLVGIWTQLEVDDIYPFNKHEKAGMKAIRSLLDKDIKDKYNIYKYGLYNSTVAFQIKNESITELNKIYKELPIQNEKDINIKPTEIINILNIEPNDNIKKILTDIEEKIIYKEIDNDYNKIKDYIIKKYKNINK